LDSIASCHPQSTAPGIVPPLFYITLSPQSFLVVYKPATISPVIKKTKIVHLDFFLIIANFSSLL
jgi:hypothetical protein